LDIFSEKFQPLTQEDVPDDDCKRGPAHKHVSWLARTLFSAAQLKMQFGVFGKTFSLCRG